RSIETVFSALPFASDPATLSTIMKAFYRTSTRRQFLGTTGFITASTILGFPAILRAASANEKLNLAIIGCGGRGGSNLADVSSENIVALCDVNERNLDAAAKKFPQALKLGKHVYCEKPLTHSVWEARIITEAAKKAKVATQMGTQIHATSNYRRVVELVQSGAIGPVTEAHVWVGRAWGWQSEEAAKRNRDIVSVTERPKEASPIPAGLHWDLWLGPAPERPFNEVYFLGPKWY